MICDHITVVVGPPGSGKTTYVQECKSYGDLVWDYDVVAQAITGLPLHDCPRGPHAFVLAMRDTFIEKAMRDSFASKRIWIISSKRDQTVEKLHGYGAQLVVLDTPEDVCLKRLEQRHAAT